ncbi:hypothetical protein CVT25_011432 [Psilocybe cyanescens]|uniref:Uncharacterized protein n=1 Tax=Psilocybe cyanescens TaxID=93625 RepID=A0A409XV85_PSICY|nr:hypothetical protein CVT25_011432 [Psilocybe cyanescens]
MSPAERRQMLHMSDCGGWWLTHISESLLVVEAENKKDIASDAMKWHGMDVHRKARSFTGFV